MKTQHLVLTWAVAAASLQAQGTVNFANAATTRVRYDLTSPVSPGLSVPVGQFTVGLYHAPLSAGATAVDVPWSAMTLLATTGIGPVAGRFLGGVVVTPPSTLAGRDAYFAVRVWESTFPSYEAARSGGGYVNLTTTIFRNDTGNPTANPPVAPRALSGFLGINDVNLVPEPGTLALGLLGAAALLGFRFRKPGRDVQRAAMHRLKKR